MHKGQFLLKCAKKNLCWLKKNKRAKSIFYQFKHTDHLGERERAAAHLCYLEGNQPSILMLSGWFVEPCGEEQNLPYGSIIYQCSGMCTCSIMCFEESTAWEWSLMHSALARVVESFTGHFSAAWNHVTDKLLPRSCLQRVLAFHPEASSALPANQGSNEIED